MLQILVTMLLATSAYGQDADGDGLTDAAELLMRGPSCTDMDPNGGFTDPYNADSDADGLDDWEEYVLTATCGQNPDTDADTLTDGDEVLIFGHHHDFSEPGANCIAWDLLFFSTGNLAGFGTSPLLADSDGDGLTDAHELSPPSNLPASNACDTDTDDDLLSDFEEDLLGLDPTRSDSDDDGLGDHHEVNNQGPACTDSDINGGFTDGTNPDSDDDGLLDAAEFQHGITCGQNPDMDADGLPDGLEWGANTDVPVDTDGDDQPDVLDEDSDNDTLIDAIEGEVDTDEDGLGDWRDPDDDNDGLLTIHELVQGEAVDSDGDGVLDHLDSDSDGDGVIDGVDPEPRNAGADNWRAKSPPTEPAKRGLGCNTGGLGLMAGWWLMLLLTPRRHG
jgi:hypothetical protein